MYLVVKYKISGADAVAQMPNDATDLGVTGVNFVGCAATLDMALANATAANNSHKASILPANNTISGGTYVDKIESILLPDLTGTTTNYLSVSYDKIGVKSDIIGVTIIGFNRAETNAVAGFSLHRTAIANINFLGCKNRLIIEILAAANALGGSTMNLVIRYKN
jgi:hypothetical protein